MLLPSRRQACTPLTPPPLWPKRDAISASRPPRQLQCFGTFTISLRCGEPRRYKLVPPYLRRRLAKPQRHELSVGARTKPRVWAVWGQCRLCISSSVSSPAQESAVDERQALPHNISCLSKNKYFAFSGLYYIRGGRSPVRQHGFAWLDTSHKNINPTHA